MLLGRFATAAWIDRAELAAAFDLLRARGPRLELLHVAAAGLFLLGAAGPVTVLELIGIPLMAMFLARARLYGRVWAAMLTQPLLLIALAWGAWQALGLLWTRGIDQGLDELAALRWAWVLVALYPVLPHRLLLLALYAAGFFIGQTSQVWQAVATAQGWESLRWPRLPDRNSGWWPPVIGGTVLAGSLGLHLPSALLGRGRDRWLGVVGAVLTWVALLATGTRGGYLAAAGLTALALMAWGVIRLLAPGAARRRRTTIIIVALAAPLLAGAAWVVAGSIVASRARAAWADLSRVIDHREFRSDTGARLLMNWWAIEAWAGHPVVGVGPGGYEPWVLDNLNRRGIDPAERSVHSHAHSAPLHVAATTGLVGLAICAASVAVTLRTGFAATGRRGPAPAPWPDPSRVRDLGPPVAFVGLLLASLFDPIHINSQTAAQVGVLMALCTAPAPPMVRPRPADTVPGPP